MRIKLDTPLSVHNIITVLPDLKACSANPNSVITHICTDSRLLEAGDLFIAIKGQRYDGNIFVNDANAIGAITLGNTSTKSAIHVNSSESAILSIAKYYKSLFKKLKATVAITGSVGKTSTKEFTQKILGYSCKTHANKGNYNNCIGLAHTIFTMPSDTEYLITEMGMNHLGEISALSKCAEPDIAIITNIGTSHIGNLGSKEAIAKAKTEIIHGMKNERVIIPYGEPLLDKIRTSLKVGYNCDAPYSLHQSSNGQYTYSSPYGIIENIELDDFAPHMLNNIAMSITAAVALQISEENIKAGASIISNKDIRARFIKLDDFSIFDDSYNASYESIIADILYLQKRFKDCPLGLFLGDIDELGEMSEVIHSDIGKFIAECKSISNLYLKGKYSLNIAESALAMGFDESKIHINCCETNADESIRHIYEHHMHGEIILFKASHRHRFDKIADTLIEKERNRDDR